MIQIKEPSCRLANSFFRNFMRAKKVTEGEILYLGMVCTAFVIFAAMLLYVSYRSP